MNMDEEYILRKILQTFFFLFLNYICAFYKE